MYEPYETRISQRHLEVVIKKIEKPVCLLGGWAVYLQANKNFKETTGRDYVGSRDIDLGFHLEERWTREELMESALARSLGILEGLGFEPMGFRYLKEFHIETEKELSANERGATPQHFVFPLYVDPIVDIIHPEFHNAFKFHPVDEPLISMVFADSANRTSAGPFGKDVWLPRPHVLLATKLNSLSTRDKEHKRLKDIADIFATLWFSDAEIQETRSKLLEFYEEKKIRKTISSISDEDIRLVSRVIGISHGEIKRVLLEATR